MTRLAAWSRLRRLSRRFGPETGVVPVAIALVLLVWTVESRMAASNERHSVEAAFTRVSADARLLSLQWSEKLAQIEALQYLAEMVSRARSANHDEPVLHAELDRVAALAGPDILQISAADAAGDVVWSTRPMPPGPVNIAKREHFIALAKDGRDHFVGRPVHGLVTGQLQIQFAKAVRAQDGTFLGMTVVSVDAGVANRIATKAALPTRGIIAVVRTDGIILTRNQPAGIGQPGAYASPLFREAVAVGAARALHTSSIDGTPRFTEMRRVGESDMLVLMALDAADLLEPMRSANRDARRWAAFLSAALACLATAAVVGFRHRRRLAEERAHIRDLAERQALLRHIAAQATDIITLHDLAFRVLFVNDAVARVLGADPRDLVGHSLRDRALSQDWPVVDGCLAELARSGGSCRLTFRGRHRDGGFRWLETEMVSVPQNSRAAPDACHYIGITRDVTGRKESEAILTETRTQVQDLLRLGRGVLYRFHIGAGGQRDAGVPACPGLSILGYTHDMFADPAFFASRLHPDDADALSDALSTCRESGEAIVEYRFRSASGTHHWLRDQMTLVTREDGRHDIVVYVTDITQERAARARLRQAERLATLGQVTTGIAHELNQPLATISMAAENGLRAAEAGGRQVGVVLEKLRRIAAQTQRIAAVIDHIRLFSHARSADPEAFDIADVVRDAMMLCQSRLRRTGVTVTCALDTGLPRLFAPRIPLEQVLLNIIVNACDAYDGKGSQATDARRRVLRITARMQREALVLSIADQAGGIPPDVIDKIFDPFFTTKRPGEGTGIGLYISCGTIVEMGGQITAFNEDGGAVFEIRLPAAPTVPAAAASRFAPALPG